MKKLAFLIFLSVLLSPAWSIEVTLDLQVTNDRNTTFVIVKTNLPPKTRLMATMINPINQGGQGGMWESKAEVQNDQVVRFEPFSKNGRQLPSGFYVLHISAPSADLQPKEVQSVFGIKGEKLTGPNVRRDAIENMVYRLYRFNLNSDSSIMQ